MPNFWDLFSHYPDSTSADAYTNQYELPTPYQGLKNITNDN